MQSILLRNSTRYKFVSAKIHNIYFSARFIWNDVFKRTFLSTGLNCITDICYRQSTDIRHMGNNHMCRCSAKWNLSSATCRKEVANRWTYQGSGRWAERISRFLWREHMAPEKIWSGTHYGLGVSLQPTVQLCLGVLSLYQTLEWVNISQRCHVLILYVNSFITRSAPEAS
jgi:hypothetical protein